jgi:hypothetical protein
MKLECVYDVLLSGVLEFRSKEQVELYSLLHAHPQPYVGQRSLTAGRHNAKREFKSCRMVHVSTVYRGRGLPWVYDCGVASRGGHNAAWIHRGTYHEVQQRRHEHQRKLERKFALNVRPSWVIVMPVVAAGCITSLDSTYADDTCTHHAPCSNRPLIWVLKSSTLTMASSA